MSYILDALKKAERERHLAKVPTVNTVHRISWDRQRPVWLWIAAAAVLVNVALLVWLLRPEPAPETGAVCGLAPAVPAPVTAAAPQAPPAASQAPPVTADRPVAANQPDNAAVTEKPPAAVAPSSPRQVASENPSVAQQATRPAPE